MPSAVVVCMLSLKLCVMYVFSRDLEELCRQTADAVTRLKKAAEERRIKLEQCLQLRNLESKASKVRNISQF